MTVGGPSAPAIAEPRAPSVPLPPLPLVGGVVFAVALVAFSRVPLLPDIADELSLSTQAVSMITVGFAVGRLIMDLPAGRIADRLHPLISMGVTGVGIAAAAALIASAGTLAVAVGGAALLGLVSAQTNTSAMKAYATRGRPGARGRSMATYSTVLTVGQTLGPAFGGILGGLLGWRAAQGLGAAVGVAVAVICAVVWRRSLARGRAQAEASSAAGPAQAADAADEAAGPGRALTRVERFALAGVPFAIFFALGGVLQTLAPLIAADSLGLGPTAIGAAIGVGGMTRVIGANAAGRVSDTVSRKAALIPGLALTAAGCGLLIPEPALGLWLGAIALIAVGSSGVAVAATMIADRVPAGTLGRHLGPYRFMGDAGLFAGPALGGLLAEQVSREAAMALAVAVLLGSAASMRLVAEIAPQERS